MATKDRADRIETIHLAVKLTDTERSDRALEAARLRSERERDQATEDWRKKAEKARLEGIESRERECLRAVEDGEELRPTDCEWSADGVARLMQLRRIDTGVIVRSRPMTDTELTAWSQGDLQSWIDRNKRTADEVMPKPVADVTGEDATQKPGGPKQLGEGLPKGKKRREGGEASA